MSYKENKTLDNRMNMSEIENNCKKYWEESGYNGIVKTFNYGEK